MTLLRNAMLMTVGLLFASGPLSGQDVTTSQTVGFEVESFRAISVSGNPGALVITGAEPGSAPNSATDATTTWAVSTNETNLKVTGDIPTDMPTGVTLSVDLTAPTGATSQGSQVLSSVASDLVTDISTVDQQGLMITYLLEATSDAGVVAEDTRVVTFTFTAGA